MPGTNKMKLKLISDKFWIILSATNEKIGTLSESITGKYTVIVNGSVGTIDSKEELIASLGTNLFDDVIVTKKEDSMSFIDGYPTFVSGAVKKSSDLTNIPTFVKQVDSNVIFAAGYYCIKFPKQVMPATTPKIQTLVKYGYLGPFKTQQEMNFHLQKARSAKSS